MSVILDHLTAILVGVVLLVAGLYVQQRGQQRTVEAAVHGNVQAQALSFIGAFERDVENMRTDAEARHALGVPEAGLTRVERDAFGTTLVRFPTLLSPGGTGADAAALGVVLYQREWLDRRVRVGADTLELFRIVRRVDDGGGWRDAGGSPPIVAGFDVTFRDVRGAATTGGAAPPQLDRVEAAVLAALVGPDQQAADQGATTATNASRYAVTPRVLHRATQQPVLDGPAAPPRALPTPPPVQSAPPSPPRPRGGGGSGSGGSSGGGSGGGSGSGGSGSGGSSGGGSGDNPTSVPPGI